MVTLEQLQIETAGRIDAEPELPPEIACAIAAWFICAVVFMLLIWFHLEEANRTGANLLQTTGPNCCTILRTP